MLIAMAGLPGTGKSTIAGLVGAQLRAAVVSVDPIEAAILTAGIDGDQPTGLAAYLVAGTLAESVLAGGSTIVVDAVNAGPSAREQWVDLAARQGVEVRFIEVMCSNATLLQERLASRGRALGQPDANAVEQSLDEYSEWSGPSALARRLTLDTSYPVEENVAKAFAFVTS